MRQPSIVALSVPTLCLVALSSCSGAPAPEPARPAGEPPSAPPPTTPPAAGPPAARAPLVVVVIVDQLGTWALDRWKPLLPADGVLLAAMERGAYHARVRYPYAATYTAPGHAALFTGEPPAQSGIFSNEIYDAAQGRTRAQVEDDEYPTHGKKRGGVSPLALRAEGVSERLHEATGGRGKLLAVSIKDRGAVLPAGKRGTLALWLDAAVGFTTSSYWGEYPEWVGTFNEQLARGSLLAPWELSLEPAALLRLGVPDDAPGEGDWKGFGTTFPHDPARSSDPEGAAARYSPAASLALLDLAATGAERLGFGGDEHADLLVVSISGVDYVGHLFGVESWEYADHLARVDRALATTLRRLEALGELSVLLTSDHGSAPLAEQLRAAGKPGGRLSAPTLARELESALDRSLGRGDWVAAVAPPFVTFGPTGKQRRGPAVKAALAWLGKRKELHSAYDVQAVVTRTDDPDDLVRAVALSVAPDAPGDLFLVPAEGTVFDVGAPEGHGTSHGTPWLYDRDVPVLAWGRGVRRATSQEPQDLLAVSASIARLLGVPAPRAGATPLPGIEGP